MAERHLFIAGCPRSGTSALVFLLNEHPQLAIGFERFKRVRALLDPFHFTPDQFFAPVAAETDIAGELLYQRLRERWEHGTVRVVGDKVPLYTRVLPTLLGRFPQGRVVVLVRELADVAESFRARAADPDDWWPAANDQQLAVQYWNEALAAARQVERELDPGAGERLFLLSYERLLAGDPRCLEALLQFIGVYDSARVRAEHAALAARWQRRGRTEHRPDVLAAVAEGQDRQLLEWARLRMDEQLERCGVAGGQLPAELDQATLSAELHAERERERTELLEQMRRPGARAEQELQTLERRLLDQAAELARRGERLRQGEQPRRGAVGPARARRITILVPHQRVHSGGVYVIEQHARELARGATVTLAVRDAGAGESDLRPLPGVEVIKLAELDAELLPAADVLLYPADMRDADGLARLPADRGRPVMLLQGYGTPGSPVVQANLARAGEVIAVAHWLVEEAGRFGAPCVYVPHGLDRDCFVAGPPAAERQPRVTIMTHHLDWKGLADALEAALLVRAARPDVELVLFGGERVPDHPGRFVLAPSREQVAELLRSSAVHVVASWEEGFGLPGAEAIACGAALASTDTRGSRDYAIDDRTALVSAPRNPAALADNVLRLLGDAPLRDRLTRAGQHHLRVLMPSWEEASRRLAQALFDGS